MMLSNLAGNVILLFVLIFYRLLDFPLLCVFLRYFSEMLLRLLPDLWFLLDFIRGFVLKFMLRSLIFCLDLEINLL